MSTDCVFVCLTFSHSHTFSSPLSLNAGDGEQPSMIQNRTFFSCRWSQGLLFHQAMVDCARAAILMPLGTSILHCRPVNKCSLVETAFLLLVTVSTVNLLTTVLNDSPVLPGTILLVSVPKIVTFNWFYLPID